MPGNRIPGSQCLVYQLHLPFIDDGTSARTACAAPSSLGLSLRPPADLRLDDSFFGSDLPGNRPSFFFQLPLPQPDPGSKASPASASSASGSSDLLKVDPGLTANAPRDKPFTTYTLNVDIPGTSGTFGEGNPLGSLEVGGLNVAVQLSPDPHNKEMLQATLNILQAHLKEHDRTIDASISANIQQTLGGAAGYGAQAQVKYRITSHFSLVATTGFSTGGPPDAGQIPLGKKSGWAFSPGTIMGVITWGSGAK